MINFGSPSPPVSTPAQDPRRPALRRRFFWPTAGVLGLALTLLPLLWVAPSQAKKNSLPTPKGFSVQSCVSLKHGSFAVGRTWYETKGGAVYFCRCDRSLGTVCNRQPGQLPSYGYSGAQGTSKLSPSQALAFGMVSNLFGSMFTDLIGSDTDHPAQSSQGKEKPAKPFKKKKLMSTIDFWEFWTDIYGPATQDAMREQEERNKRGAALLEQMGGGITGGGRDLKPMDIGQTQGLQPVPMQGYDTAGLSATERLLCTSYFSFRALEEIRNGNKAAASFFNDQADKVINSQPTVVQCKNPRLPASMQQPADAGQQAGLQQMSTVMKDFNVKIKRLQHIEVRIIKVRQQKTRIKNQLRRLDEKAAGLNARISKADNAADKASAGEQLQQALAAKPKLQQQAAKLEASERKLRGEAKTLAKHIDTNYQLIQP